MATTATATIRGVNLGGWLVLEKWITPSLFEASDSRDEYGLLLNASAEQMDALKKHRQTFITEKDFKWLKACGIDAVRIPVGHWIFGEQDSQPFVGCIEYLDQAFVWAETHGLKVLIDLHAAPGSQNGEIHSGRAGSIDWDLDPLNIARTLRCIDRLAQRYRSSPALLGISLLNEPARRIPKKILKRFYTRAYKLVRDACGENTWVVFSDGWMPRRWRKDFTGKNYNNFLIDHHLYQIFTERERNMDIRGHIEKTLSNWRKRIEKERHRVVVGEWTITLDVRSLRGLSGREKGLALRAYGAVQQLVFEQADAWFYWTYKTEAEDTWSFRDAYNKGWIGLSMPRFSEPR